MLGQLGAHCSAEAVAALVARLGSDSDAFVRAAVLGNLGRRVLTLAGSL